MDMQWEEEELEDIRDRIKDFLIDYFDGRDELERSERLEDLAHYKNWPAHAAHARNDDPHCILEGLARDILEAIAEGKVDVGALAGEVLHTFQKKACDVDNPDDANEQEADNRKAGLDDLKDALKHFLSGYGRSDARALRDMVAYPKWRLQARRELDRRATRLLGGLPDAELAAIANGDLDIAALAWEVSETLDPVTA